MEITATCKMCGKPYIKRNGKSLFCSDACRKARVKQRYEANKDAISAYQKQYHSEHPSKQTSDYWRDRSRKMRGSKEYTKQCIVCGNMFTTWLPQKKTCSEACKIHNATIAKRERERNRKCDYDHERQHQQWIRRRYGSEEAYIKWLAEQERVKQERAEQARIKRETEKESRRRVGECVVCGKAFETYNPAQKTCSPQCGRKLANARKQKRIPKEQIIDSDITLESLYRRDSGVCYLCGKQCDWSDKDGNIVGPSYPSIDHLIPVARGGLHAWNNVRLAHFKCNVNKSDSILPNAKKMIPTNAYQFKRYKRDIKKRTAQYTKSGCIVAVFESTAEAERVTGIKQRGIQDCARGERKSCGGFVWKYE